MCKIIGYVRCSCDKSDVENQRFEIMKFCDQNGMQVDEWVEETVSGTKDYSTRKLGEALEKADKTCRIITCEISRIGRNMFAVMDFLNHCIQKGCQVWTIKDNFRLGDDLSSKVVAFAFALSAEIERSLLSQRTKQSLARLKAEGKQLGRPPVLTPDQHRRIDDLQKVGLTLEQIAEKLGVGRATVCRILAKRRKGNEV